MPLRLCGCHGEPVFVRDHRFCLLQSCFAHSAPQIKLPDQRLAKAEGMPRTIAHVCVWERFVCGARSLSLKFISFIIYEL